MTPTPRRLEVLQHAADGLNRAEIAARMTISVETVKSHLKEAKWDMRANTTTHAVANALREGLIE